MKGVAHGCEYREAENGGVSKRCLPKKQTSAGVFITLSAGRERYFEELRGKQALTERSRAWFRTGFEESRRFPSAHGASLDWRSR